AEIAGGFGEGFNEDPDALGADRLVGVMDPANTDLRQSAREAGRIANVASWLPGSPTAIAKGIAAGAGKLLAGAKGVNLAATVFHGSPHKFDAFDMSKIGTGEGAQAYGHGLYMAEQPSTAAAYKQAGVMTNW